MPTEQDRPSLSSALLSFVRLESASGILLLGATVLAMIAANTPLVSAYELLLDTRLAVHVGETGVDKPLLLWINDGLMAVFFTYWVADKLGILLGSLASAAAAAVVLGATLPRNRDSHE